MAYLNQINKEIVKIRYQKLSTEAAAPEISGIHPATITLRAKETFNIENGRYAKAYTGLVLSLPKGYRGTISPLPLRENEAIGDLLIYQSMQVIKPIHLQEISVELFNRTKTRVIIEKGTPIGYLSVILKPRYRNQQPKIIKELEILLEEVSDMVDTSSMSILYSGELSLSEIMI